MVLQSKQLRILLLFLLFCVLIVFVFSPVAHLYAHDGSHNQNSFNNKGLFVSHIHHDAEMKQFSVIPENNTSRHDHHSRLTLETGLAGRQTDRCIQENKKIKKIGSGLKTGI